MGSMHVCLEDCQSIVESVRTSWPLAFAEAKRLSSGNCVYRLAKVPLSQHNEKVASLAWTTLFLARMARAIEGIIPQAAASTLLAAALHDIGKSARHYLDTSIPRLCPQDDAGGDGRDSVGKLKFNCHEHVTGLLLHQASNLMSREGCMERARVLWLAMLAVARHHVAQAYRHPRELQGIIRGLAGYGKEGSACINSIVRAVSTLDQDDLMSSLPRFLMEGWVARALEDSLSHLKEKGRETSMRGIVESYVESASPDLTTAREQFSLTPAMVLRYVNVSSGILIVSDILVSSHEGRHVSEAHVSHYAQSWKRELDIDISRHHPGQEVLEEVSRVIEGVKC